MKDRIPGAPGQYVMTVDPTVSQNLLVGEPVAVTLVRDDKPEVEGTPYNKASVLPDDLALNICPLVPDPTPADALRGLYGYRGTATLLATAWTNNRQNVLFNGVTANNTLFVGPGTTKENSEEYSSAGILPVAQSAGVITFECDSVPSANITVNIVVLP